MNDYEELQLRVLNLERAIHGLAAILLPTLPQMTVDAVEALMRDHFDTAQRLGSAIADSAGFERMGR